MARTNWARPQFVIGGKRTEEWNAKPKYPDAADRFIARKEKEEEERKKANRTFEDLDPKDPHDQLVGVNMDRLPW